MCEDINRTLQSLITTTIALTLSFVQQPHTHLQDELLVLIEVFDLDAVDRHLRRLARHGKDRLGADALEPAAAGRVAAVHRAGKGELLAEVLAPQLSGPRVRPAQLRVGGTVVDGIVVVEESSEEAGRIAAVDGRMELVRVPDEVEVIAWNEKRVRMGLLQEEELSVAFDGGVQEALRSVVRQRYL